MGNSLPIVDDGQVVLPERRVESSRRLSSEAAM